MRVQLDGPGWPDIELADFADALGQTGLGEVARLVPERRAADPDSWAAIGISILRQQLAALSGDVDAHVAVLAENLHGARQYGEIVTVLRDAGRDADAERWARRSLAEAPAGYGADGLREQLAGLLLTRGGAKRPRVCPSCGIRAANTAPGLFQAAGYGLTRRPVDRDPGLGAGYLCGRAQVEELYVRELISVLIREDLTGEAWDTASPHRDYQRTGDEEGFTANR